MQITKFWRFCWFPYIKYPPREQIHNSYLYDVNFKFTHKSRIHMNSHFYSCHESTTLDLRSPLWIQSTFIQTQIAMRKRPAQVNINSSQGHPGRFVSDFQTKERLFRLGKFIITYDPIIWSLKYIHSAHPDKLSIVYLLKCIESVLGQCNKNFSAEIIEFHYTLERKVSSWKSKKQNNWNMCGGWSANDEWKESRKTYEKTSNRPESSFNLPYGSSLSFSYPKIAEIP